MTELRVAVIGLGFVGLPTAVCLAEVSEVTGIDLDQRRVEMINRGIPPFREKGLASLLRRRTRTRSLNCSTSYDGVVDADFAFVTVGTPSTSSGNIDLTFVRSAAESIGEALSRGSARTTVVVKSTVVPGTTSGVVKPILEKKSGKVCGRDFGLCSNPEFLREGSAIEDTYHPSRIVVGSSDGYSSGRLLSLYRRLYGKRRPPIIETTPETAELIKYASNALLATKVSFINTVARICEKVAGVDVREVARGMGLDPRIGPHFLQAGPGFGGSCFPKDLRALIRFAEAHGVATPLLNSVLEVNEMQPEHVVSIAEEKVGEVRGKRVAVLGLAFNANTDDVRESRSIELVRLLVAKGARVRVYDPLVRRPAELAGLSIQYAPSTRECISGAELAFVMTASSEFAQLSEEEVQESMASPYVVDARRILEPSDFRGVGLAAVGLGPGEARGESKGAPPRKVQVIRSSSPAKRVPRGPSGYPG